QEMLFIWRDAGWSPQMIEHFFGHNHTDVRGPARQFLLGEPLTTTAWSPRGTIAPVTDIGALRPPQSLLAPAAPGTPLTATEMTQLSNSREQLRQLSRQVADNFPMSPQMNQLLQRMIPERLPAGATPEQLRSVARDLAFAHDILQLRPEIRQHLIDSL